MPRTGQDGSLLLSPTSFQKPRLAFNTVSPRQFRNKHVALTDALFRNGLGNVLEKQGDSHLLRSNALSCHTCHQKNVCVPSRDTWGTGRTADLGLWSPARGLSLQGRSGGPRGAGGRPSLTETRTRRDAPQNATAGSWKSLSPPVSDTLCKGVPLPSPAAGDSLPMDGEVESLGQRSFPQTPSLRRRHHLGIQSFTKQLTKECLCEKRIPNKMLFTPEITQKPGQTVNIRLHLAKNRTPNQIPLTTSVSLFQRL